MYNPKETAERIKEISQQKGIKISELLSACGLNINTLSSMGNRGSWIQANSLAMIADYLNVSVDFLLGRTYCSEKCTISDLKITINGTDYKLVSNAQ